MIGLQRSLFPYFDILRLCGSVLFHSIGFGDAHWRLQLALDTSPTLPLMCAGTERSCNPHEENPSQLLYLSIIYGKTTAESWTHRTVKCRILLVMDFCCSWPSLDVQPR